MRKILKLLTNKWFLMGWVIGNDENLNPWGHYEQGNQLFN
jgi:hypothetical protein